MIRLGLIGCGAWGWRYIPSAAQAGNATVTHVSHVGSGLPDAARTHLSGLVEVRQWEDMKDVDAVVVATPPQPHALISEHFLSQGIPVMVEKPMTMRVGEAGILRAAVARAAVPFLVNHVHLFSPAYEAFRELYLQSGLAECHIRGMGGGEGPYRDYSALWDYGPHDVSMCVGLGLGDPTDVTCVREKDGTGAAFETRVRFKSGSDAAIRSWNGSGPKSRRFRVDGEKLVLVYDELAPDSLVHNGSPVMTDQERPLTRSVRTFADAVRTGQTDWRFGTHVAERVTVVLAAADAYQETRQGPSGEP